MYRDRSGALRQQIDTLQLKGQGLRELDGRAIFSDGRELWWDAKSGGTFESLLNDPVKAREFIKTMTAYKGLAKNHAEMTGNPTDFYVISQFKLPQGLEKFRSELLKKGIPIIEVSSKTSILSAENEDGRPSLLARTSVRGVRGLFEFLTPKKHRFFSKD